MCIGKIADAEHDPLKAGYTLIVHVVNRVDRTNDQIPTRLSMDLSIVFLFVPAVFIDGIQ